MIICKTPFRISFFGGGTDFPEYYKKFGGCVIGSTIDKYSYFILRDHPKYFDHKHRVVWSLNEDFSKISQIKHPIVKAVFKLMKIQRGSEIHHLSDLPGRSGIGSSSSFCVGLINSLYYRNKKKNINKNMLHKLAIHTERNIAKDTNGDQDSIWAAHGGFNKIIFNKNGCQINKLPLNKIKKNELEDNILLFNTSIVRNSSTVEKEKIETLKDKIHLYDKLKYFVTESEKILTSNNNEKDFGYLLNDYWNLKKKLSSNVSNTTINEIYKVATENGAIGGKILGAGGGGYLMLYCQKKNQKKLIKSLKKLIYVKIKFSTGGSQIIKNIKV